MISFAATSSTYVGQVLRIVRPQAKFWKVVKIENGRAYAKPDGFGPAEGCC